MNRQSTRVVLLSSAFLVMALTVAGCYQQTSSRASRGHEMSSCYQNLQYIQVAKHNWAIDEKKISTDIPTWGDLHSYLPDTWSNSIPRCPSGGTYTIGQVDELPTCSIGGSGHMLYK